MDAFQVAAHLGQRAAGLGARGRRRSRWLGRFECLRRDVRRINAVFADVLVGARDRETFLMEQALDELEGLDIARLLEAMLGARVLGLENRKLGLPEAQHVSLDADGLGRLADFQAALIGERIRNCGLGLSGFGFIYAAPGSIHERGFLLLLTSSFSTWLALNESTRRESMIIGSPV